MKKAVEIQDASKGKELFEYFYNCCAELSTLVVSKGLDNLDDFGGYTENMGNYYDEPVTFNSVDKLEDLSADIESEIDHLKQAISNLNFSNTIGLPLTRGINISNSLSQSNYDRIILDIHKYGVNMSYTSSTYFPLQENDIRNTILNTLNTLYPDLNCTAESHNDKGRADILIKNEDKINVFIAECKIWSGSKKTITDGLKQLLQNYTSVHDKKLALIIFNKTVTANKVTEEVMKNVPKFLENKSLDPKIVHKYSVPYLYNYQFDHPKSPDKKAELSVFLININNGK